MRYVKREWARYEAMLGAVSDPTSLEAAVAKRAHKRLAEIAKEVNLTNSGVVELANQVCPRENAAQPLAEKGNDWLQSRHSRAADSKSRCHISEHARSGLCGSVVAHHLDLRQRHPQQRQALWQALSKCMQMVHVHVPHLPVTHAG